MSSEVMLTGTIPGLLLTAALLAWPVTHLLLARYRRAVWRAMRRSASTIRDAPDRLVVVGPQALPSATAAPDAATPAGPRADRGGARTALAHGAQARKLVWRRYAQAGAAQALVLTVATMLAGEFEALPVRTFIVWLVYAWPLVFTAAILSRFDARTVTTAVVAYLAVLLAAGAAGRALSGVMVLWLVTNLPATVVVALYLHRAVRAVGVVVLTFVFVGLAGAEVLLAFVGSAQPRLDAVAGAASWLGLGGVGGFVALVIVGFSVAAVAGWGMVGRIAHAFRERGLPDQLVLVGSTWALFAAQHGLPLAFDGLGWAAAGGVGFAAFWAIGRRPLPVQPAGPRLLMLRMFSSGRRNEKLFRHVAGQWEHVGPVRLIGGPDLALATVDVDEFLVFAAGRLESLFVRSVDEVQSRLSESQRWRDRHGRHRVQELLCFDDTWQATVQGLLRDSDVVLMDVRGYTSGHEGVRHELALLARTGMLSRTTLVVDSATDRAAVKAALQAGGGDLAQSKLVSDLQRMDMSSMLASLPA